MNFKTLKAFILVSAFLIFPSNAQSESLSFGHNLTATTHVLKQWDGTVGFQSVALGLTDKLSMGTSPWLLNDYWMYNLYTRYQLHKNEEYSQAIQVGFFDTFENSPSYEMTAGWLTWVQGFHFSTGYSFFVNVQFMYYWNEQKPWSLRRPRVWRDPTEFTISTLHEVPLVNGFYIMGEMGLLGVIRKYPIIHGGASLQWRSKNFLVQFGYSLTGTWEALESPISRQDYSFISNGEDHGLGDSASGYVNKDYSVHPEFALQYFF